MKKIAALLIVVSVSAPVFAEIAVPAVNEIVPVVGEAVLTANIPLPKPNPVQLNALIFMTRQILRCARYSFDYGRVHAYEEGCVNRLMETSEHIFNAFMPHGETYTRHIGQIRSCAKYSLNSGSNRPYEEGCVQGIVNTISNRLEELKRPVAPIPPAS